MEDKIIDTLIEKFPIVFFIIFFVLTFELVYWFGYSLVHGKLNKSIFSKKYFLNISSKKISDKSYYRNIIKEYNIVDLSFVYHHNCSKFKDVVAQLLQLYNNKKVDLDFNKGLILVNQDKKFNKSEEFIIERIENGKLNYDNDDFQELNQIVLQECESKYIVKSKKTIPNGIKPFLSIIIFGLFFLLFYLLIEYGTGILAGILALGLMIVIFYLVVFFAEGSIKSLKKTKKGKELYQNINGLKKYLNEFSKLSEKKIDDIKLWDDYLLYSIIFEQNTIIVDEFRKKFGYNND